MKAYKAFYLDGTDLYDRWHHMNFEELKLYTYNNKDERGRGGGFYSSKYPEDTLVYFGVNYLAGRDNPAPYKSLPIVVTEVEIDDDYEMSKIDFTETYFDGTQGYENNYVSKKLIIKRIIPKEELFNEIVKSNNIQRQRRFLDTYPFEEEELFELIKHEEASIDFISSALSELMCMKLQRGKYGTRYYEEVTNYKRCPGKQLKKY